MSKPVVTDEELKIQMNEDYPLIPMSSIDPEARMLAVAWVDGYERQGMDIPGKQKLASDIMNYSRRRYAGLMDHLTMQLDEAVKKCNTLAGQLSEAYAEIAELRRQIDGEMPNELDS